MVPRQMNLLERTAARYVAAQHDVPRSSAIKAAVLACEYLDDIQVHSSCKRAYTREREVEAAEAAAATRSQPPAQHPQEKRRRSSAAPGKATRSSAVPHNRSLCIYCQKDTGAPTTSITTGTDGYSKFVWECAEHDHALCVRLSGCIDKDLSSHGPGSGAGKASGALYHKECHTKAHNRLRRVKARLGGTATDGRTRAMAWVGEEMLAAFQSGKRFVSAASVWQRYCALSALSPAHVEADLSAAECPEWLLGMLRGYVRECAELVDLIAGPTFVTTVPCADVAVKEDRAQISQITESLGTRIASSDQVTPEMEQTMHLFHAAMACRAATDALETNRGRLAETSEEAMEGQVPDVIKLFLHVYLNKELPVDSAGPPRRGGPADSTRARLRRWATSIGSDLVFCGSNGRVVPDKHVHHANCEHLRTRSKEAIEKGYENGHMIGYGKLLKLQTTLANQAVEDARVDGTEEFNFIPQNLITREAGGGRIKFSMDNLDFKDDTHATNMLASQEQPASVAAAVAKARASKSALVIGKTRGFKCHANINRATPPPRFPNKEGPKWDEYDHLATNVTHPACAYAAVTAAHPSMVSHILPPATARLQYVPPDPGAAGHRAEELRNRELLHRMCHERAQGADAGTLPPPCWTGFNQTAALSESGLRTKVDVVGETPLFNGAAHLPTTQHTMVLRAKAITKALMPPGTTTVMTADQAVYNGLKALQWANPEEYADCFFMMGTLHILIHFWTITGLYMEDAGIDTVLAETDQYGPGQAAAVIKAGSTGYNRSTKGNKRVSQGVFNTLWPAFKTWCIETERCTEDELADVHAAVDAVNVAMAAANASGAGAVDGDVAAAMSKAMGMLLAKDFGLFHREWQEKLPPTQRFYADVGGEYGRLAMQLIRADRERDWLLHVATIEEMLPYFHAYDRHHYARWLLQYWSDCVRLKETHPDVYVDFLAGQHPCGTSPMPYNSIGMDQALEHKNKNCKSNGGVAGIVYNWDRLMAYYLSQVVRQLMQSSYNGTFRRKTQGYDDVGLDDDTNPFAKRCARHSDCLPFNIRANYKCVTQITTSLKNYHLDEATQATLDNLVHNTVCDPITTREVFRAREIGLASINTFLRPFLAAGPDATEAERRKNWLIPVHKKNIVRLCKIYKADKGKSSAAKDKATVVKQDKDVLHKVCLAVAAGREVDFLHYVGDHENSPVPVQTHRNNGDLKLPGNKAVVAQHYPDPVPRLPAEDLALAAATKVIVVLDGCSVVQMIGKPEGAVTFGDCAKAIIKTITGRFTKHGVRASTVHIVFDRYWDFSTKEATRAKRQGPVAATKTVRMQPPTDDMPLPRWSWDKYIGDETNKINYLNYLSESIKAYCEQQGAALPGIVLASGGFTATDTVYCSDASVDVTGVASDQEEADTRLLLAAKHGKDTGHDFVILEVRDNDVKTIAVCMANSNPFKEELPTNVWVQSGFMQQCAYVCVSDCPKVGADAAENLIAWYTFTGCDQNGQLGSYTKAELKRNVTAAGHPVGAWAVYEKTPRNFAAVGRTAEFDETAAMAGLQRYVCQLHSPGTAETEVRMLRYRMFMGGEKSQMALPPTYGALLQHAKRAHFVAWVWHNALVPKPVHLDPCDNGWSQAPCTCDAPAPAACKCDRHYVPITTLDPLYPKAADVTLACNCAAQGASTGRTCERTSCVCRKAKMVCTTMCGTCHGGDGCDNTPGHNPAVAAALTLMPTPTPTPQPAREDSSDDDQGQPHHGLPQADREDSSGDDDDLPLPPKTRRRVTRSALATGAVADAAVAGAADPPTAQKPKRSARRKGKSKRPAARKPDNGSAVTSWTVADEVARENAKQSMDHAVHAVSGPRLRRPNRMLAGYEVPDMHADGHSSPDTDERF